MRTTTGPMRLLWRTSGSLLFVLGIWGLVDSTLACSTDPTAGDAPSNEAAQPDAAPGADAGDAAVGDDDASPSGDGASKPAPAAKDVACLGDALPITFDYHLPHVKVTVGGVADPAPFLLDVATTGSVIDMSSFGASPPATTGCDPSQLGDLCTFADLDFFGSWGSVTLRTSTASILGTDFFTAMVLTIDYAGSQVRSAKKGAFCTDAALVDAGFTPLSTAGFYATDLDDLKPLSDVDDTAPSGVTVPDVPAVPLVVGGVTATAQLDTGFDDSVVPFSVNINDALFDAVKSSLVRDASHDVTLSTCTGGSEPVDAYTPAPGATLSLAGRAFPQSVVFVKHAPSDPATRDCGGIATYTAPFAQVGHAFFAAFGAIVFDPFTSRVWLRQ